MSDQEIIMLLSQRDNRAYHYLYSNYYQLLCTVAYSIVQDHYDAECIVGDLIFHLWEHYDSIHIQKSLKAFLISSTRNRALNHIRTAKNKYEIHLSKITDPDIHPDRFFVDNNHPLGHLLTQELERDIQEAVNNLPTETNRVFRLSRFEGMSNQEIADTLQISINTVKYHIKQALALLRKALGKYFILAIIYIGHFF